ncbi:MAG: T9SS type A sorting domain-containing protein [Candidatus Cloacimonetes bacterium]|nr:T9SS type A sorting domain-containing protein [Candidatus Cloacimonadota bacterium]
MNKLLLILSILTCTFLFSQTPPDTLWTQHFGGIFEESSTCIRQINDGGYIIFGATDQTGNNLYDIWLIKTDEAGNLVWDVTFGGEQNDFSIMGQQTLDDGFIIAGTTDSYGNGMQDFWLIKTDESGNEEWNQTYGTLENDRAQYVEQTADGGFILTGGTGNYESNDMDVWLIKTDAYGNLEWEQTFGGAGNEKAYTVHQEDDGSYILAGSTSSFGNGNYDMYLIKTDESGNELWYRTFGGAENENAYSMQLLPGEGYILAGYTKSFGQGEDDVWLIKVDEQGNEIWNEVYGTQFVDYCYSVAITSNGDYILSGLTNSTPNDDYDVLAMKVNDTGEEIWTARIGGSLNDFSFFVEQTDDGGYILTGYTNSFGNGDNDVYAVKLESDGSNQSDEFINQPLRYNLRNYPNPFNPLTTISFNLTVENTENTELSIYNMKGQKVKNIPINSFTDQPINSVIWNGTDNSSNPVSSGVYYIVLKQSTKILASKKMMLIK